MLHLLYVLAFAILAFLAVASLIRNLITLGFDSQRMRAPTPPVTPDQSQSPTSPFFPQNSRSVTHPELLDESGKVIDEPLLVMRSITVEDVREQLDALYKASPGQSGEASDEA